MKSFWILDRMELAFCIIVFAVFSGIATYATQAGPGVSPDSTGYMRVAENLLTGHGLVLTPANVDGKAVPFTSQPPLFPLALAILARLWPGPDGVAAAGRWLPILCGSLAVFPFYWIGRALAGKWAGLFTVLMVTGLQNYIWITSFIWSDTFFIFLVGLNLCLLVAFLQRETPGQLPMIWFLISGIGVGLATLTRTVGIFLFVAGISMFVLSGFRTGWRRLWIPAGLYIAIYTLLVAPWYIRNLRLSGTLSGYVYVTDRIHLNLGQSFVVLANTLVVDLPPKLHFGLRTNPLGLFLIVGLGAVLSGLALWEVRRLLIVQAGRSFLLTWSGWPVVIYVMASLAGLWMIGGTVQIFPGEWSRYLGSVYPFLIVLAMAGLIWLWQKPIGRLLSIKTKVIARVSGISFIFLLAAVWVSGYARPVIGFAQAAAHGQQYTAPEWVTSEGIAYIREHIPADAVIYTDQPAVIWYWTKRDAEHLPLQVAGQEAIHEMFKRIRSRSQTQYVIVFTGDHHGVFRVTEADLILADQGKMLSGVIKVSDSVVMKVRQN